MMHGSDATKILALVGRSFGRSGPLSATERQLLRACIGQRRSASAGAELGPGPQLILVGCVGLSSFLPDGRRQICSIRLPGDLVGFASAGEGLDSSAVPVALTRVESLGCENLEAAVIAGEAPGLSKALAQHARLEQARLWEHILRLGRLTASERIAHWILELQQRLQPIGLADAHQMPWSLTQVQLGDFLGLSVVHVNRVLQSFRRTRIVDLRSGRLKIVDRARLQRLAQCGGQDDPGNLADAQLAGEARPRAPSQPPERLARKTTSAGRRPAAAALETP